MDTAKLIERCRQGDGQAIALLYTTYSKRMKSVCRRYFKDSDTVDDIMHDAFVVILTSLDKLRDPAKAEPWMMSIARNIASKAKEQSKSMQTTSLSDAETVPDGSGTAAPPDMPDITKLINTLPEGYRNVFRLSVFEGMTHKQIAETLGIEPHTSSSQLSRAKKMLRAMLRKSWLMLLMLAAIVTLHKYTDQNEPAQTDTHGTAQPPTPTATMPGETGNAPTPTVHTPNTKTATHKSDSTAGEATIAVTKTTEADDEIETEIEIETDTAAVTDIDTTDCGIEIWIPEQRTTPAKRHGKWSVKLSYSGAHGQTSEYNQPYSFKPTTPSTGSVQSSPVVGPIDPSKPTIPSVIDNWSDYATYIANSADASSSKASRAIARIALNNAGQPGNNQLLRTSIHHTPTEWAVTLKYKPNGRLGMEAGLCCDRMVSDFTIGTDGNQIQHRQTINYVGIPVTMTFGIKDSRRLNLYFALSAITEIPSASSLRTDYYIFGEHEAGGTAKIHAPWQWSAGCGLGLQYNITPRIGLVAEPSLMHYFPRSGVETYRTERPTLLDVPVGIRFSW